MYVDDFIQDKLVGKTPDQKKSARAYYKKKLLAGESISSSHKQGRKVDHAVEKNFIRILKASADPDSGFFIFCDKAFKKGGQSEKDC